MQASSVPMERVFSSAKELTRLRRANLSAPVMEMLQVLKYGFRQDRLNFMATFVSTEQDLVDAEFSSQDTRAALAEAFKQGAIDDIASLMHD
jgi:hypothetical protein